MNAANRALTLDASQPETHYALGTALMRLGKADEGEKELKEFERLQQKAAADRARDSSSAASGARPSSARATATTRRRRRSCAAPWNWRLTIPSRTSTWAWP